MPVSEVTQISEDLRRFESLGVVAQRKIDLKRFLIKVAYHFGFCDNCKEYFGFKIIYFPEIPSICSRCKCQLEQIIYNDEHLLDDPTSWTEVEPNILRRIMLWFQYRLKM